MQPKEGRKELAPREIKFRYRRLDTTIRERAGSSQEGRKRAKDTPGYFLCLFFLSIPNSRCSRQKSCAVEEREQTGVSHGSNREKGSPTISIRLFVRPAPPSSRGGAAGKARPLVRLGGCCPLKRSLQCGRGREEEGLCLVSICLFSGNLSSFSWSFPWFSL